MPVLVDFYATWCGPCQMMAPILGEVSRKLAGQLKVVKIDTDRYPQIASQYQIQALPTLVLFKHGQPCTRIEGGRLRTHRAPQECSNMANPAPALKGYRELMP